MTGRSTFSRRLLLVVALAATVLCALPAAAAAADRSFSIRWQTHTRGNIATAANTLMSCSGNGTSCVNGRAGTGGLLNTINSGTMAYVDADSDGSTFNSSGATLTIPAGATVAWAGLYWGGDVTAGSSGSAPPAPGANDTIRFDTPAAGGYSTVTASQVDTSTPYPNRFQAYADVTSQVQAAGGGSYWAANVQAGSGGDRYAGWTLVVAYRLATQPVRNLSVYDGMVSVESGTTPSVTLSGFQVPASGPVTTSLGFTAWEGELGWTNDPATLNGTTLSDAANPADNFFNASIATNGSHVTTKTPNYVNQFGFDSDVFTGTGLIANGATSATIGMSSAIDVYHAGVATFAVDQIPEVPTNTAAPGLSGTATDGQALTATPGSWNGTTVITHAYQWQRCDSAGANCSNIAGATGSSYTLTPADVGSRIRAMVTATNTEGTGTAHSSPSAVVQAIPPASTAAPAITGTTQDGDTLSASTGTFSGTAPFTYSYQWRRCNSAGMSCSNIAGATGSTYSLVSADVGSTIRVAVTATNGGGSATGTSLQTAVVTPRAPANSVAPALSGTATHGQSLSVSAGTWTGTTPMTFSYGWQRCDAAGANCSSIAGATGTSYTLAQADVGQRIRAVVTATNVAGSASASTSASAVVGAQAPVNTSVPTLSGTARDGDTLSGSNGSWTGTTPISYSHQWRRCDAAGANCTDIAGATGSSYSLTAADVGATVRIAVTASNAAGSATATSAPSATVAHLAPSNSTTPSISGTTQEGSTLTAATGTWSGTAPISFAFQWQRCDAAGLSCVDIAGATGSSYELVPADVGGTIRVVVTATNGGGSASAGSPQTAVVTARPPVNTSSATVSGTARDGETLTAANGSWTGTAPISFAHQWQRCDSAGANCADIAGATGSTYELTAEDVAGTVRVVVTATNVAGSASAGSAPSGVVAAQPPANTSVPTVSGTARDGETLTAANGSWTGTAPISFSHQWQRCDATGANCADIAGATGSTYELTGPDVAATVRVVVTATNAAGSASAGSAPTGAVEELAPSNDEPPAVSGTPRDGETLTADPGEWSGTAPFDFDYAWERCDADGTNCVAIPGATDATYDLGPADVGHRLRVVVTATNGGGAHTATSAPGPVVAAAAPDNVSAPSIGGTPRDGETLTAANGTWTGTAPISFTYQWQRCNSAGASCSDIGGASGSSYELTDADAGNTVRVVVTGTNSAGSDSAAAPVTATVEGIAPTNDEEPAVTGTPTWGETLTADPGEWSGTAPFDFAYAWQRCDASGANCEDIAGADEATYELGDGDVGHTVRVVVTATNVEGSQSAPSAPSAVVDGVAPDNVTVPALSGSSQHGQVLSADDGTWTGTGPMTRTFQWQRCDENGDNCSDIASATGSTYSLGGDDVGRRIRVVVTATNDEGSSSAASQPTAVIAAAPATPSPQPSQPAQPAQPSGPAPSWGAPAADLSSVSGSRLAATACQQAGGSRQLPFYVPGAGQLRVRVTPNGVITKGAPMTAYAVKPKKRVKRAIRRINYTLNGRRIASKRKAPYLVKISPALLSKASRHTLVVEVVAKKGKPRVAIVNLSSEPCPDLFSVLHRPNRRAAMLGLRVDTRKSVRSVTFKVSKRLLAKPGTKGSAGTMRLGVAGQRARTIKLKFPRKRQRVASLVAAKGGPQVTVKGGSVTVSALPPSTGIVELKLKVRGTRRTPRTTLRASIQTEAGSRSLRQKLGAKR